MPVRVYTAAPGHLIAADITVDVKHAPCKLVQDEVTICTVARQSSKQHITIDYGMACGINGWKVMNMITVNLSLTTN